MQKGASTAVRRSGGLLSAILDLLFPPRCVFCNRLLHSGEKEICASCQMSLPWLTEEDAEQTGAEFALCASPLHYQDHVRASIHRYKFRGLKGYAKTYGRIAAQCVSDHLRGRYDLITWVPLSSKRLKKRGYDQAMLLAMSVALNLDGVAVETMRKMRDNSAQSGIDTDEGRRSNVKDVYGCTEPELVRDKRILLVDDVITTGSTLSECAQTLRAAGSAEVVCVTLARAR